VFSLKFIKHKGGRKSKKNLTFPLKIGTRKRANLKAQRGALILLEKGDF
jgi:hypothetical protein